MRNWEFFAKIVIFFDYYRVICMFFLLLLSKNDKYIWSNEIFFVTLHVNLV